MLSSAALRARVASIIDALSRTAVAEIAKVVEDGMGALRLQLCQQESEIGKLRSDVELLHVELSAAQRVKLRADGSSAGDVQSLPVHTEHNDPSGPEFQVKAEPVDEMSEGELVLHGGGTGQWRSATQRDPQHNNAGENSLDAAGGRQPGPCGPGLLGHGPLRSLYRAARKRTVKRLMLTKGCICPTCGKCFERASHLERHKQIHTGEKPHRCDLCGRRFSQKCGLKEHMKIHSRYGSRPRLGKRSSSRAGLSSFTGIQRIEPRPVEIPALEEKPILVLNPCSEAVVAPGAEGGIANSEDGAGASVRVKTEPVEESITHRLFTKEVADALAETGSSEWTEAQYPGGSGRTGLDPLPPVPAEASCSSFPGKVLSQTSYGSSDPVLISSDSGSCATAALYPSSACEMLKAKKCSACSYCGKLFHRSGHLERHLRIHTGEKPYGCHICGRCFNQNSSLKGHMRTHQRPGDTTGATTTRPMTFTVPERPALENPSDAPAPAASRHQAPGSVHSEAAGEVKAEDAGGAAVTPAAQLQDQIPERDGTQEELVSGLNAMASGNHQDELKRFICSHCRQSFDTFSLFEMHQCKTVAETLFTCEICDKVFNHETTLKLHHKLHTI